MGLALSRGTLASFLQARKVAPVSVVTPYKVRPPEMGLVFSHLPLSSWVYNFYFKDFF